MGSKSSKSSRCLVLSVMHGGTQIVMHHLLKGRPIRYYHLGEEPEKMAMDIKALPNIFVPVRHPLSIARTWLRRGQRMEWLPEALELLATEMDPINPWYIPVDTPDRDSYVDSVNKALGWDLDPAGWPLIGHDPVNSERELQEEHISLLKPVLGKHEEFFRRWHPDIVNIL